MSCCYIFTHADESVWNVNSFKKRLSDATFTSSLRTVYNTCWGVSFWQLDAKVNYNLYSDLIEINSLNIMNIIDVFQHLDMETWREGFEFDFAKASRMILSKSSAGIVIHIIYYIFVL